VSGCRIGGCIAISASESRTVHRQIFDDICCRVRKGTAIPRVDRKRESRLSWYVPT
jgi:hypothetical protein